MIVAGSPPRAVGGGGVVETVDEYLRAGPEPQQTTLVTLRATLRELRPHADEALFYGMPAFVVDGKPVAGYDWSKGTCASRSTSLCPRQLAARLVAVKSSHICDRDRLCGP